MADKYWSVALVQQDGDLQSREIACAQIEGIPDANYWVAANSWKYAAQPGWGEKYQYALDTLNPNPGRDEAVITDGDILSATQAIRAAEFPGGGND